ncbi:hypothetical protein [Flagellimonas crocea]|uniref:hypothetical protein n=1 Tax=Flagellimonas crocea TaxID=3067311 RepID=UPI00296FB759|nr:hypothetical protein [Muricauda sp. DH64]
MKKANKYLSLTVFLVICLLNSSCRKEEFESQGAPPEQALEANTNVANLLLKTTMNDGSDDNIIDQASCFSLQLPVTVTVNGQEVTVSNKGDFNTIESIFEESLDDTDTLVITFPVTLIFSDHSTMEISNQADFDAQVGSCNGENEEDDDIECIDIEYPVFISLFNTKTETLKTLSFPNDKSLFMFVVSLKNDEVANIQFPVSLILSDGSSVEVNDLEELENEIDNYRDDCNEDDNNDFDDDDCKGCNPNQLEEVFISCTEWGVNSLLRNNQNLSGLYSEYIFNFEEDGSLTVTDTVTNDVFLGTWLTIGESNNVQMEINVLGLDDFNGTWDLNEVAQGNSQGMVILRMGTNILRFESGCF